MTIFERRVRSGRSTRDRVAPRALPSGLPRDAREIEEAAAVVATVPSHEDDNPHHLHLLDAKRLQALLGAAGARRVTIDGVRGHLVALAMR